MVKVNVGGARTQGQASLYTHRLIQHTVTYLKGFSSARPTAAARFFAFTEASGFDGLADSALSFFLGVGEAVLVEIEAVAEGEFAMGNTTMALFCGAGFDALKTECGTNAELSRVALDERWGRCVIVVTAKAPRESAMMLPTVQ